MQEVVPTGRSDRGGRGVPLGVAARHPALSCSQSHMVSSASWSKQQTCLDCKKNFCMTCSSQVGSGPRLCLLCQRVRATGFQRDELMKVKVKDLRDYLSLHDISTEMCREKEELVLLVLGQQPVISQEGRTRAPTLSPDFPEQQAFLTPPHASTVPPTSASLPSSPAQAASVSPAQAQESQQVRTGLWSLPIFAALRAQFAPLPAGRERRAGAS